MSPFDPRGKLGMFYPHGLEATRVRARIAGVTLSEGETWYRLKVETDAFELKYPYIKRGEEYWCYADSFTFEEIPE
jgi:hypothetical protein